MAFTLMHPSALRAVEHDDAGSRNAEGQTSSQEPRVTPGSDQQEPHVGVDSSGYMVAVE